MSRLSCHTVPVEADLVKNAAKEPEGERVRRELIDFLTRNKIVGIMLDTASHVVRVESAVLPPKIKSVLTKWGSIYVVDESPDVDPWATYVPPVRPAGWDDNVVPPMTHPYGRHWEQPDPALIVIDDSTATMSRADFDELLEYSATTPTGAYEGKMWKASVIRADEPTPIWMLCWYGYGGVAGHVSNNRRRIVLVEKTKEEMPAMTRPTGEHRG